MKKLYVCWAITVCFCSLGVSGQVLPPKPVQMRLVNDYSKLLTDSQQIKLEHLLTRYYDSTTIEMVVMTLPNIGNADMESFSVSLFRAWGIGNAKTNNGILLLVTTDSGARQARITTGYGMEGDLPDMRCKRILDMYLVPHLKSKNYYRGLLQTVEQISKYASPDFKIQNTGVKRKVPPRPFSFKEKVFLFFVVLMYFVLAYFKIMKGGGSSGGKLRWRSSSSRFRSFGGGSTGGGGAGTTW